MLEAGDALKSLAYDCCAFGLATDMTDQSDEELVLAKPCTQSVS